MQLSDLNELFLHELKDIYDAEHQLLKALPRMAKAASSPELRDAFENHLSETEEHVTRLESVFEALGETPERETCAGMKGLIAEGEKVLKSDADPDVMDAALIAAAQRVEHYEMAAYGTLIAWAGTAGIEDAPELLDATLAEEKAADEKLSTIAESGVNLSAESSDEAEEGQEEEKDEEPSARRRLSSNQAGRGRAPASTRSRPRRSKSRTSRRRS